jgi:hypothetical protein
MKMSAPPSLCRHLIGQQDVGFFRVLRGEKLLYDLCCAECASQLKANQTFEWFEADAENIAAIDEDDWELLGWVGKPGIEEDLHPFDDSLLTVEFPSEMAACRAVYPLDLERVLAFDGHDIGVFERETWIPLIPINWREEEDQNWANHALKARFHVSKSGRFAALVNDYGQFVQVFDLQEKRVTMQLNRGDYHPETQPFPVAFFQNDGHDLLVHAVDWNRLEISDSQNGELLTPRDAMKYETERPEHYLDYFHGALYISPDGKHVVDDGWVWHPIGSVAVWSLEDWLKNPFESEDGASRSELTWRNYHWNSPICWIDENRVAIAGIGFDDEAMLDGARIFDVAARRELAPIAGPLKNGRFWSDGARLFSIGVEGLEIWELESGARIGKIAGFAPQFQIESALLQIEGNHMTIWRFN